MKPLCIAHRGCHWDCYENTKEAFLKAANGNYYGIEMDIHLTKDKKWIIHHDPYFLTNGKKVIIKEQTLETLQKMPLDNEWNYEAFCPTLEEYLTIVKASSKRPIIEIKPKNPSFHNLKKAIKIIKKYYSLDDITIIAFYPWPLFKLKMMHQKLNVQLLVEHTHPYLIKWAYRNRWGLDAEHCLINQEVITKFHKKKLPVNAWTVDSIEEVRKLEALEIDMITSNKFDQTN